MKRNLPVLPAGEIFCLGFGLGAAYFLANVIAFFPGEQLFLMSSSLLKLNLFIYSFCIWTLGFLLFAVVAHAILSVKTHLGHTDRAGRLLRWLATLINAANRTSLETEFAF